ncbi:MAG: uracil-DNA glycosylase [Planctomycetaceae bacterium]
MTSPSHQIDARAKRMLMQKLQSLYAAGVRHLPRVDLDVAEGATDSHAESQAASASAPLKDESDMARPAGTKQTPEPIAAAVVTSKSTGTKPSLSLPERQRQLQILAETVSGCRRCAELAEMRTQTVFGVGDPQARIMFIGEAPGADEDKQGEPFVGRAGQLLDKIIEACKLKREEIYIANILKCRPPGNRAPLPAEAGNCREYLDAQIEIVQPEYIVCWGTTAAQNLLGTAESIGKLRQRFFPYGSAKVLCTYHPSYLLRNPPAKKDVWEDMKFFFREQGITL